MSPLPRRSARAACQPAPSRTAQLQTALPCPSQTDPARPGRQLWDQILRVGSASPSGTICLGSDVDPLQARAVRTEWGGGGWWWWWGGGFVRL